MTRNDWDLSFVALPPRCSPASDGAAETLNFQQESLKIGLHHNLEICSHIKDTTKESSKVIIILGAS